MQQWKLLPRRLLCNGRNLREWVVRALLGAALRGFSLQPELLPRWGGAHVRRFTHRSEQLRLLRPYVQLWSNLRRLAVHLPRRDTVQKRILLSLERGMHGHGLHVPTWYSGLRG